MALTPEQIAAARNAAGLGPIQNAGTPLPTTSLADRIGLSEPAGPKLGDGPAGEFGAGVVKGVTEPLVRTGAFIEKGLDQTVGRVINKVKGNGFTPTHSGEEAMQAADEMHNSSSGGYEDVGHIVGTIAPYFTGAGEEELAAKAGPMIAKLAETLGVKAESFIPKMMAALTKSIPSAAKNTAIGTAQTGDLTQGVETGIGGEVLKASGDTISAVGKAGYKALAIPTSAQEAKLVQAYKAGTPFKDRVLAAITGDSKAPITADETAFQKGLLGTESMMGVQAKRATSNLWDHMINPALERSQTKVNMQHFFGDLEKKIISENPEKARQQDLLEALDSMKESYRETGDVSMKELQSFKEGWAQFVPEKAYKGKPIAGAFNDVKNMAAEEARQALYKDLGPEAKQAYIDYGNLKSLQEWGQKAMTGGKFKGGTGGFLTALKDAIVTPIATTGGMTVYKVGEGMEFIGPAGAKTLADLFNEESQPSQPQ